MEEAVFRPYAVFALNDQIRSAGENELAVLVVDDVLPIVEEMLTLLELRNIPAAAASSLEEAILALQECGNISVAVCDVRLGKESGFELIDRVRQDPVLSARKLDYVFVTGDPTGIEQLPEGFASRILTKPVRPKELINLLNELLGKGPPT